MSAAPSEALGRPAAREAPVGRASWVVVACLTAVSMLALLDKYIVSLLIAPIKADLHLSDMQIGLIIGAAFAVANLLVALPAGAAADRGDRRAIVAAGVALWSVMAAACGLARSFPALFWARAGVGLGEGIIPPAAYSLIRDSAPPERRGRAYSVFAMANTLGPGLSLVLGGALVAAVAASGVDRLPIVGAVRPWQLVLLLVGVGGAPLALLGFAFREPGRAADAEDAASFAEVWGVLRRRADVFAPLAVFGCAHAALAGGIAVWLPAFVGRTFHLAPLQVGLTLGSLLLVTGPLGLSAAGVAMDALRSRGRPGAAVVAVAAGAVLLAAGVAMPLARPQLLFWAAEAVLLLSSTAFFAVTSVTVAETAPPRTVGKIMALLLLLQGVLGTGAAPPVVGLLAERVFPHAANPLGAALSLSAGVAGAVGLLAALRLLRAEERLRPA